MRTGYLPALSGLIFACKTTDEKLATNAQNAQKLKDAFCDFCAFLWRKDLGFW
jgi:hypothetical protein